MLKFVFWLLFIVNGALFAYGRGYLAAWFPDGREPARMAQQVNPGAVKVVRAPEADVAAAGSTVAAPAASTEGGTMASATAPVPASAAAPAAQNGAPGTPPSAGTTAVSPVPANGGAPAAIAAAKPVASATASTAAPTTAPTTAPAAPPTATQAAAKPAAPLACVEVGNFDKDDAARFEQRLKAVGLLAKASRQSVQDTARNMVYIPPQGSREGAEKKAGELRRLGITDFFIIQDGENRHGISLGVFRSEEAARGHLADLNKRGVNSARIGQFTVTATRAVFQFKGLDAAGNAALEKVRAGFPKQEARACP